MNPESTYDGDLAEEEDIRTSQREVVRKDNSGMRKRVTVEEHRSSKDSSQDGAISTSTFFFMLAVAALFDLASLIPGLGRLVSPVATFTFYVWFKRHGVRYDKASRMLVTILTPVIEVIPFIGAFPTWMLQIVLFNISLKAEQKSKE